MIQDWTIKPLLRSVPGIAEISPSGGYEKQIVVQPDPQKMMNAGIGFDELTAVISGNVENAGGGVIQQAGNRFLFAVSAGCRRWMKSNLPIKFGFGKEPIKVKRRGGSGHRFKGPHGRFLGERRRNRIGHHPHAGRRQQPPHCAESVDERLGDSKTAEGVEIRTTYDRSDLVNRTISTVKKNLFEGAVLVVAILLLLLGNVRAARSSWQLRSVGHALCPDRHGGRGVSGNLMSLGAIDFGLIIDGAGRHR